MPNSLKSILRASALILLTLLLTLLPLAAPAAVRAEATDAAEPALPRVLSLKGPTSMGAAAWFTQAEVPDAEDDASWLSVDYEIFAAPDLLVPEIVKGNYEMAFVPGTMAAILQEKTEGGVSFLATSTTSVLYLCERGETLSSVEDLRGRSLVLAGKGTTPDQLLQKILGEAGLTEEDLEIEYLPEHQACVEALAKDPEKIALLPEPFVTVASTKLEDLRPALDLNDLWQELFQVEPSEDTDTEAEATDDSAPVVPSIVMGVLIGRREWVEANPEVVADALASYTRSVEVAEENPELAAEAIESLDLFPQAVALQALPRCGLDATRSTEGAMKLQHFLELLDDPKLPVIDFDGEFYAYARAQ